MRRWVDDEAKEFGPTLAGSQKCAEWGCGRGEADAEAWVMPCQANSDWMGAKCN